MQKVETLFAQTNPQRKTTILAICVPVCIIRGHAFFLSRAVFFSQYFSPEATPVLRAGMQVCPFVTTDSRLLPTVYGIYTSSSSFDLFIYLFFNLSADG